VRKWLLSILIFTSVCIEAQDTVFTNSFNAISVPASEKLIYKSNSRKLLVGGGSALVYGGSFIFLNEAWYKGYPRSSFHSFDDGGEWLQVDKIGHAWTAYHTSRVNTALWPWAGVDEKKSVLLGTGTSLLYMLSIEYLDGRSAEWGWSWPDAAADIFGAGLFASQQLAWKDQKISIKFSSHRKSYKPQSLEQRADALFGKSLQERLLKDYNAQSYWLSFNSSLFSNKLPSWLNIAVGYGADDMFGGYENIARDKDENIIFDRRDIKRYRQWYLSPDIDLTKIKTKSKFLRTAFSVLNVLKIPAPALELSNGEFKGKWVVF
jgi:uncharacterized protein YfiM (DUF2279 family)